MTFLCALPVRCGICANVVVSRCVCSFLLSVPSSNVIMQTVVKKNVKIFSEKIVLLLNRGGETHTFVYIDDIQYDTV